MVHRDLKPENILLMSKEGLNIKVTDFGLAECIQRPKVGHMGTCYYMSPEMITQKPHNDKTDIFSTGVIAYELLSGDLPFYA